MKFKEHADKLEAKFVENNVIKVDVQDKIKKDLHRRWKNIWNKNNYNS